MGIYRVRRLKYLETTNQMGMFDYVRCHYPLPIEGANGLLYQSKDLDCQMDLFEIREDGTLWRESYDVEDHSDPNAEGIMRLCGMLSRVNQRWERVEDFTGEVSFYDFAVPNVPGTNGGWGTGWIEWSAYFLKGQLQQLNLVSHDVPPAADAVDPTGSSSSERPRA